MLSLIIYSIISVILAAAILSIVAFSLLKASENDFHPILTILILLFGLLFILVGTYNIILVGLDYFNLGSDSLIGGLFSVYGNISQDIWFNIGSIPINYSITRGGISLTMAAGVFLGVVRFVLGKIKKK